MTELNNGSRAERRRMEREALKGGVMLGSRQVTLTVEKMTYEKLKILAAVNSVAPSQLVSAMLEHAVEVGWQQFIVSKLFYVVANWPVYYR